MAGRLSASRRWVVGVILALAVLTGFGAIMTTWVKRQALDTNNWTSTSSKLLANPQIQNALGIYLADQLFTRVDVTQELRTALPPRLQGLAGPASGALHEVALRTAPELLARPRVQDAWVAANRAAHKQLLNVLDNRGNVVSTANGNVVLNLHSLVDQLAATLGLEQQVAKARGALGGSQGTAVRNAAQKRLGVTVPQSAGGLVILRSDQLATAQDIAKAIRSLSIILTVLSLGLFAVAIWMARPSRRVVLRNVGWCLFGLGFATLLARRLIGNDVVDSLVRTESAKPAVHEAFLIGTSLLYAIAVAFVVYGALIVLYAWLTGGARWATWTRRKLAPVLRERPALVYGIVACAYLLVLVWGPTPAFRKLIPIVLIGALIALGVEMLRRQTGREFPPQVPAGDGDGRGLTTPPTAAVGHG
jgi:hypothetical protein